MIMGGVLFFRNNRNIIKQTKKQRINFENGLELNLINLFKLNCMCLRTLYAKIFFMKSSLSYSNSF